MELLSLQTLLFISFLCLFIFLVINLKQTPTTGLKFYPLVGSLPQFLKNSHRFLDWTTQVLRDCPSNTAVFRRPGKVQGIITANPSNVEHMLKANFQNYPKGPSLISLLQDFLGRGIFNSDGDLWKVQRKTAS
ncbi:Cytochrome P450 94B3 like, partial [Actinidia chinensis var. chinensis]